MPRILTFVAAMGLATAAAANPPEPRIPTLPTEAGALLSFWTQFVAGDDLAMPNSKIELRFVLADKTDCGKVTVQQTGAGDVTASLRGHMTGGAEGAQYTVTVCTATLDPKATEAHLVGPSGPMTSYPDDAPARVNGPAMLGKASGNDAEIRGIALGDSGCRGLNDGQRCIADKEKGIPADWHLPGIAQAAADLKPDFVLHVGDYHYFYETDYTFWHDGMGKDRFGYWLQEILLPAAPLLRAAPWMFGRGNHERCTGQWVGNAWHILFDPRDELNESDPCDDAIPPTWAVDLAPADGNTKSFRFFMIDNAQGGQENRQGYLAAAAAHPTQDSAKVGWISHYPPLKLAQWSGAWHFTNVVTIDGKEVQPVYDDIHAAMKDAVSPCVTGKPCMPTVAFAGHQHFYQEFQFDAQSGLPVIQIVGHGGVMIGPTQMPGYGGGENSSSCSGDFAAHMPFPHPNGATATVRTAQVHGFVEIVRDATTDTDTKAPSGWKNTYHWVPNAQVGFPALKHATCPGLN